MILLTSAVRVSSGALKWRNIEHILYMIGLTLIGSCRFLKGAEEECVAEGRSCSDVRNCLTSYKLVSEIVIVFFGELANPYDFIYLSGRT